MDQQNHLLEILSALSNAKVDYIVAGGVAAVLQGVERATMDLDISLLLSAENVARFLSVMDGLGMIPRVPVPGSVLAEPEKVRAMVEQKKALVFTFVHPNTPFKQIDVFIAAHLSHQNLIGGTEEKRVGGITLKVLTKQKLLELKKGIVPPRDKDTVDIKALEKLLQGKK